MSGSVGADCIAGGGSSGAEWRSSPCRAPQTSMTPSVCSANTRAVAASTQTEWIGAVVGSSDAC